MKIIGLTGGVLAVVSLAGFAAGLAMVALGAPAPECLAIMLTAVVVGTAGSVLATIATGIGWKRDLKSCNRHRRALGLPEID
jgi:hypothetical protein